MAPWPQRPQALRVILVALGIALVACGQRPTGSGTPAGSPLGGTATGILVPSQGTATPAVRDTSPAEPLPDRPPALKVEQVWFTEGTRTSPRLPIALARDRQGHLIVLDAGAHRVLVFDDAGQVLHDWGSTGSDARQFRWQGTACEDTRPPDPCPGLGAVAVDGQGHIYGRRENPLG